MSDTPTIGGFDRDQEDQDIVREGVVNTGQPKSTGSVLDQLRAKFDRLDEQRTEVFRTRLKNGSSLWLELVIDITEDEVQGFSRQAERGNRESRRSGKNTSSVLLAAAVINAKNTRVWFEDPAKGGAPVLDTDGDPLTVHSREWLEALSLPEDRPLDGLRETLGDPGVLDLHAVYNEVVAGDGASVADPTPARSGG